MKREDSEAGVPILRHQTPGSAWTPPAASDGAQIEAIVEHFSRFVAPPTTVYHEIISSNVHVDVHIIPGDDERPLTLFTTGMSDRAMAIPAGAEEFAYAELMIRLPADWKLDQLEDPRWYWPVRWLKMLARMPHDLSTWLGFGHTIPNGDPATPLADNTELCGMLLLPPISFPREAYSVTAPSGRVINLWALYPVYDDEMKLKLKRGTDALLDAFERAKVSDVVAIDRRSSVARKKVFGLF